MKRRVVSHQANLIGDHLRQLRLRAGLSQNQLSNRLNLISIPICRGSISRIENGQRIITDVEVAALAKVLGVSPNKLFQWDE